MNAQIEQFLQIIKSPVWDGNLISKGARDHLYKTGLISRCHGWNFITRKGIEYAVTFGLLAP